MCVGSLKKWIANITMQKKNKVGALLLPDFKTYYTATDINIKCHLYKDRQIGQWIRIQIPEIRLYIYGQLIFHRGVKAVQWRKDSLFNK